MRQVAILCAAAGVIAVAASCHGDSVAPHATTVAGVYTLSTVNGATPPLTLGQNDTARVDLLSGTVTFGDDGTFLDVVNMQFNTPSGTSLAADTARGTYTYAESRLFLQPTDGHANYQMTMSDTATLTETTLDFVIVYHRR